MSLTLIRTKICFFINISLLTEYNILIITNIFSFLLFSVMQYSHLHPKIWRKLVSVASRTDVGSYYIVNVEIGRCECSVGIDESPCWYQFILWSRGFSCCPNFLPRFDNSQRKRFPEIAVGSSLEHSFYDIIHQCSAATNCRAFHQSKQ